MVCCVCFRQQKLGFDDYNKFLEDLTKNKKVDLEEIKSKMASCGSPGFTGVTVRKFVLNVVL
jgi:hypothetical protein